ncbi:MAG: ATP-binding protein, partial [Pseudomonadota bacterium]|nr:ATP-binding protein [Pseudomonadota bacterium]
DRTREISEKNEALQRGNRALVKAKEDAVRRARARANFLASMSHEIRTPLNGVLGMLGLALEGELDAAQRNRLEIALNAGESLLGLLNDILDISKVEAGKLNLENIPFSVRHLVEECATLHAQQARRKRIQLVSNIDPKLPEHFLGDPTRLRQVLNNLVSNAIKFTEEGSVKIRVGHSGGSLRIDVVDTGIGMSREGLHRIFSPFSQADADTTRLYGGTGLGLTLCRQLVERMHGQILVDSQEGAGTHFTVTLPLPVQDPEAGPATLAIDPTLQAIGIAMAIPPENPHRPAIEALLRQWGIPVRGASRHPDGILLAMATAGDTEALAFATSWQGRGVILADDSGTLSPANQQYELLSLPLRREELYRCLNQAAGLTVPRSGTATETPLLEAPDQGGVLAILLVEDNQVNQMVASSLLKKLGHTTDHAENGLKAIQALEKKRYDLVLMDCQMPVMDGYEATRRIRQNPQWKDLPIIAVTANVMQGDREDCLASGMNDYITKPYRREELREAIDRWRPSPQDNPSDAP